MCSPRLIVDQHVANQTEKDIVMPQQETSSEGSSYEHNQEFPGRYSAQYGQSQIAQKLPRRVLSKKKATRIQLWTAFTSLLLIILLTFIIGGSSWNPRGGLAPAGILLLIFYIVIIALNVLVFVLVWVAR